MKLLKKVQEKVYEKKYLYVPLGAAGIVSIAFVVAALGCFATGRAQLALSLIEKSF